MWLKYLPSSIRSRLERNENLRAAVANTGWLFADKIVRILVGLLVVIWIARYLGPQQFGLYNYALALVALFGVAASLGLDGVVVRELVREPHTRDDLLGTSLALRLIAALTTVALCILAINILRPNDTPAHWIVAVIAVGTIFQAFDVIDLWFQSQVKSKYTVLAKNTAFILASASKIILVVAQAPLIAYAWVTMLEAAIGSAGLVIAYMSKNGRLTEWRFRIQKGAYLLKESWPLMLSGIAIMTYMKIDQVMLATMLDDRAVGIYSAAAQISEVWYFIPMAITASVTRSLVEAKMSNEGLYHHRIERLFRLMGIIAASITIPMTFAADIMVHILFGADYADAGPVLAVHIWSTLFVFIGVAQGPWTLNEGLMKLALIRTALGAIANVAMNILLIPAYGPLGAALATVISYALSAVALNAIDARTRKIFIMQLNAFNPWAIFKR